jgi:hypothetical protein
MNDIQLSEDQSKELKKTEAYFNGAKNFIIDDDLAYQNAVRMLQKIKTEKKKLDDMRKSIKQPILEAGRKLEDLFRQPINNLTEAEQAYKKSMINYYNVLEEKNKKMELVNQERIRTLEVELKLAEEMDDIRGYELINQELQKVKNLKNIIPITEGISFRENWKGEGFDLEKAVKAISEGKAPLSIIKFDDMAINQLAKSTKGTVDYPGIKIYKESVVAAKRG